jgi:uncharacterized protein with NRDE domain
MCLLIVMLGTEPAFPLVVAGNRDERYERPAKPMDVLPRILGGRDELAGGTWMAVNEHGVVAGLTNRPSPAGRDETKRSRGQLPLALAMHRTAGDAAAAFATELRPGDYNPSWLVVADRTDMFTIDMTGEGRPTINDVGPGIHIVENSAPGTETVKVAHVRALLARTEGSAGERLRSVMGNADPAPDAVDVEGGRPAWATAPCVHSEHYGTRWSGLVQVPASGLPHFSYTDGPPCDGPFTDATHLWEVAD